MRQAIVEIIPLVGVEDTIRLARTQFVGQSARDVLIIVGIAVRYPRHLDEFWAGGPQHVFLFLALRIGNDDESAIAARVGDERQPDSGIAGGALDDEAARSDIAAFFSLHNHLARRSVFHRLAGI